MPSVLCQSVAVCLESCCRCMCWLHFVLEPSALVCLEPHCSVTSLGSPQAGARGDLSTLDEEELDRLFRSSSEETRPKAKVAGPKPAPARQQRRCISQRVRHRRCQSICRLPAQVSTLEICLCRLPVCLQDLQDHLSRHQRHRRPPVAAFALRLWSDPPGFAKGTSQTSQPKAASPMFCRCVYSTPNRTAASRSPCRWCLAQASYKTQHVAACPVLQQVIALRLLIRHELGLHTGQRHHPPGRADEGSCSSAGGETTRRNGHARTPRVASTVAAAGARATGPVLRTARACSRDARLLAAPCKIAGERHRGNVLDASS